MIVGFHPLKNLNIRPNISHRLLGLMDVHFAFRSAMTALTCARACGMPVSRQCRHYERILAFVRVSSLIPSCMYSFLKDDH